MKKNSTMVLSVLFGVFFLNTISHAAETSTKTKGDIIFSLSASPSSPWAIGNHYRVEVSENKKILFKTAFEKIGSYLTLKANTKSTDGKNLIDYNGHKLKYSFYIKELAGSYACQEAYKYQISTKQDISYRVIGTLGNVRQDKIFCEVSQACSIKDHHLQCLK